MVLVPTASTKKLEIEMDHPRYLNNDKCYKLESLGGVRGMLEGLKEFQVDLTTSVNFTQQSLNHLVFFAIRWQNGTKNSKL